MSWKELLTNLNPFKKKEVVHMAPRGRKRQGPDPMEGKIDPKDAKKELTPELIDNLKNYKSVKFQNTKLNEEQQMELMELIARFAHIDEINEYFFTEHEITLSPALIYQYKRTAKWKPIIKKLREKYLLGEEEVAGRHKRVRLDRADKIYNKAYTKGDLKTALQANRDSQEMVEGRNVREGDLSISFNQYNGLSDEEIKERMKEVTEKLSRITIDTKAKEVSDGPSGESEKD